MFWTDTAKMDGFLYFPVAFLIKTPLGLLISGLVGAFFAYGSKRSCPFISGRRQSFSLHCSHVSSHIQLGHRYILACYPFLTVAVAGFSFVSSRWLIAELAFAFLASARVRLGSSQLFVVLQ